MTHARIMLTTAASADEARNIAHALVERRLAACVNIVPQIESVYRWQGKVETASEYLLVIKTQARAFAEVLAAIEGMHSYDVPECIMLEVENGSREYLDWLAASIE